MTHYTPKAIGEALASFLPDSCESILEPAVGAGDLLIPILKASAKVPKKIVCIDIRPQAITKTRRRLPAKYKRNSTFKAQDFLKWYSSNGVAHFGSFDCIVMNPPFEGRAEKAITDANLSSRKMPIEWAFVHASVNLLRDGGRLLAVVPASVVCAKSYSEFRSRLLRNGTLRIVHELPYRTFEGVESKMYLLVWDKIRSNEGATLMNHELEDPETIKVAKSQLKRGDRFDYSYHSTQKAFSALKSKNSHLKWTPLGSIATLIRGQIPTPPSSVLHSTNCDGVQWVAPKPKSSIKYKVRPKAKSGDILVKRVARNCLDSFGVYRGPSVPISDCVISIRLKPGFDRLAVLLALRATCSNGNYAHTLTRGTGCTYVNISELRHFEIPLKIPKQLTLLTRYKKALRTKNREAMKEIESMVLKPDRL